MKFAGIAILALGASAYVVNDAPKGDAVEARTPGSGPALASYNMGVVARHRTLQPLSIPTTSDPLMVRR